MRGRLLALMGLVLLSITAYAAPAPWGIAINNATKECAPYWGGDEFVEVRLPEGWVSYYPQSGYSVVNTSLGSCRFEGYGFWYARNISDEWRECARTLGCTLVEYDRLGQATKSKMEGLGCYTIGGEKFWGNSLLIDKGSGNCALVTCSRSDIKVADAGLELSQHTQVYDLFATAAGNCTNKQTQYEFEECCSQLGYKYIPKKEYERHETSYAYETILKYYTMPSFFSLPGPKIICCLGVALLVFAAGAAALLLYLRRRAKPLNVAH